MLNIDLTRPFRHGFCSWLISLTITLCNAAKLAYRQAESVLHVLWNFFNLEEHLKKNVPHHSTIREWNLRNGCAQLTNASCLDETESQVSDENISGNNTYEPTSQSCNIPGADEETLDGCISQTQISSSLLQAYPGEYFVLIADLTVDIGVDKCLSILALPLSKWLKKKDKTLSYADVFLVGVYVCSTSNGEFVRDSLEDSSKKLDHRVRGVLTDGGPDVKRGVRLYIEKHSNVIHICDSPHKLANVIEKELKADEEFQEYTKKLKDTRLKIQQTIFQPLMPKKQRTKARFMNIADPIKWASEIILAKRNGLLTDVSEEKYQEYFSWVEAFLPKTEIWEKMIVSIEIIKDCVRKQGLSKEMFLGLERKLLNLKAPAHWGYEKAGILSDFQGLVLDSVEEEVNKLPKSVVMPGSTEVLESIFGSYKYIANSAGRGITGNVLRLPAIVNPDVTAETVKQTMEACSGKGLRAWLKKSITPKIKGLKARLKGQNLTIPVCAIE